MSDINSEKIASSHKKKDKCPRRMKSFSEALGSLGSSFHNIFDKNLLRNKKKGQSKSVQHLDVEQRAIIIAEYEKGKNLTSLNSDKENHVNSNGHIEQTKSVTPPPTPKELHMDSPKEIQILGPTHNFVYIEKPHTLPRISETSSKIKEDINLMSKIKDDIQPTNNSPILAPKQKRDRSASMCWVDFLTEEGVQISGNMDIDLDSRSNGTIDEDYDSKSKDEFGHEVDLSNRNRRQAELAKRKIWFGRATETDSDCDENEENDDATSSSNEDNPIPNNSTPTLKTALTCQGRKIRKDSIAILNKARVTPEPPLPHWKWSEVQHKNVDDLIFDMFCDKNEEIVQVSNFLVALERTGLRRNDPRLTELFDNLRKAHSAQETKNPLIIAGSVETLRLNREEFKSVITDNIVLISKAFRQQFIIPEFPAFCAHIERMFNQCKNIKGGKVAGYIPQLARVDPNLWGVSVCTIDGQRFSIGDTLIPFTVQSCSKPLTYAIALNELGEETVHQYVGQEPSGRNFNELVLDQNKKPHNPMVNAGAIIVCSLLKSMVKPEMSLAEKFDYTQEYFKKLCGGEYVGFNNAVFLSERDAADRNYALGFYMRENKCFPEGTNLKECMDYYFQICSMECNCEAMSVMAATLANGGICPVSGEKVLKSDSVRDVLSLMHSCGMYDYSGQFAFKVGLPAKSGVCGAIMVVVPNVLGMAVWSPPLDVLGNTVRGVELCKELVQVFNFHKYDNLRHASHKLDPRRHRYETKGLNIVNLLFSAASGDVTSMRRHHLSGMDMNASDYDGRTALHLAAAEGHLECVVYLLRQCRVKHNPTDRWGHFPEDDSVRFGHEDVTDFLKNWTPPEDAENPTD